MRETRTTARWLRIACLALAAAVLTGCPKDPGPTWDEVAQMGGRGSALRDRAAALSMAPRPSPIERSPVRPIRAEDEYRRGTRLGYTDAQDRFHHPQEVDYRVRKGHWLADAEPLP